MTDTQHKTPHPAWAKSNTGTEYLGIPRFPSVIGKGFHHVTKPTKSIHPLTSQQRRASEARREQRKGRKKEGTVDPGPTRSRDKHQRLRQGCHALERSSSRTHSRMLERKKKKKPPTNPAGVARLSSRGERTRRSSPSQTELRRPRKARQQNGETSHPSRALAPPLVPPHCLSVSNLQDWQQKNNCSGIHSCRKKKKKAETLKQVTMR